MDLVWQIIIPYLISLAASKHAGAILEKEQEKLKEKLEKQAAAIAAAQDRPPLKEQLRLVGTEVARSLSSAHMTAAKKHIHMLFADPVFQEDLARWLTAWRPPQKKEAESVLSAQLVAALRRGGVEPAHIREFESGYFDRIEKVVFSNPVLAQWRLGLAMDAALERLEELEAVIRGEGEQTRQEIIEQHRVTRQEIKEMAALLADSGIKRFSTEQRLQAERRYRDIALESCDIMDLHNLPESDRHLATRQQELKLRRLYVPLRIKVEMAADQPYDETPLDKLEDQRLERKKQVDPDDDKDRVPVGERLGKNGRLVLLGDPGSGKTTLLRWIATAYLLRLKEDPAHKDLPDVATLPDKEWLPIVVRCRDLDEACKTGAITDILAETFRKAQLTPGEADVLQAVIIDKLATGQALLLVDGLDEIAQPGVRARFCQQIERLHIAYPLASIIVTCRIVGYREMKYRLGRGFEHAVVAGFRKSDKDEFARRWCEITEMADRRQKATEELFGAIHGSDRIERLAVNPMLLTTLALVKRKVGKLPERRADLYHEAVLVLLNWRSEVDEPIDPREAMPQLEYVAYDMCRQGVQQLPEDDILDLLDRLREEYPNLRALKKHEPADFLRLLERRTGILSEVGEKRHKGRQSPIFEFRHLTFQEYLAALALVEGKFPGRDKTKGLAGHIAPLAGETGECKSKYKMEVKVKDNWREVLRLCAICCADDEVDAVLLAILNPVPGEDPEKTAWARAILALSCLADEPNVGDETAHKVFNAFARHINSNDAGGNVRTTADAAAMGLVGLEWAAPLRAELIREFCRREPLVRQFPGSLCGMMGTAAAKDDKELEQWWIDRVNGLQSGDESEAIGAALDIMEMAYEIRGVMVECLVSGLLGLLNKNGPAAHAAAWALGWLSKNKKLTATTEETGQLISFVSHPDSDIEAVRWVIKALGEIKDPRAVAPLMERMADEKDSIDVRETAIEALGKIKDPRAMEPLIEIMTDEKESIAVRVAAIRGLGEISDPRAVGSLIERLADENFQVRYSTILSLGQINDPRAVGPLMERMADEEMYVREIALGMLIHSEDETDRKLLTRYFDGAMICLDPQEPIDEQRIAAAATELEISRDEVYRRYERLAKKYNLKLARQGRE